MPRTQVARPRSDRAQRVAAILLWFPALLGVAYVGLFAARLPSLIERVYWNSDAATAALIAETMGSGTVVLERFGWFTALWFTLLTRSLPLHRHIWEVAPYLFSLGSVTLLIWASWRLAGRWAAAMTATLAVATSPFVSYDLVTLNFHTSTWVPTVVLAAYSLWLAYRPSRARVVAATVVVSVFAGTSLASDSLFAVAGLGPLFMTAFLFVRRPQTRFEGGIVLASALAAFPIAWLTTWAMTVANVDVSKRAGKSFADAGDLWPNCRHLLRQTVQLVNGDYFIDATLGARTSLSFACAAVMLISLAAPFVLVGRELRSSATSLPRLAYGIFWAGSIALTSAAYILSSEGEHGGFYLIPLLYAIAATTPVLVAQSTIGRGVLAVGVTLIATASLVNLVDTKTTLRGNLPPVEHLAGLPPVASVADRVVVIAQKEGATYGYADYWDAASLTWSTHLAVRMQPVSQCKLPSSRALCAYAFNVVSSWFDARSPKSFVLRDSGSIAMQQKPPATLGPTSATYALGDGFTMYVYPYDIASRLDYSYAPWRRGAQG